MTSKEFADILDETLEDFRFSRSEKRAVSEIIHDLKPNEQKLAELRHIAFDRAKAAAPATPMVAILEWLEGVIKLMIPQPEAQEREHRAEAYFGPGEEAPRRIASFIQLARRTIDVCVFTVTDNRLSRPLIEAHQRGIQVRVLTDNEKSFDKGSDIEDLRRAGIPLRVDNSGYHMHHKFAIADGAQLLTGSYNWTRSASKYNEENFLITGDPRLIVPYQEEFDMLWEKYKL